MYCMLYNIHLLQITHSNFCTEHVVFNVVLSVLSMYARYCGFAQISTLHTCNLINTTNLIVSTLSSSLAFRVVFDPERKFPPLSLD